MRVCTSFLLLGIFAYIHCSASNKPADNKRSVNLALETVLEFSDKDKAGDIKFLDNVQNFITKVKTVINKNSNVKTDFRRDFKTPTVNTITDFIQEAVKILNTYDNTTFKDFFDILDEEIRKYHYRGCKFYELMENYEIRKMIAVKLDLLKSQPASDIKADINALTEIIRNVNHDNKIIEVVNYINSLYRQDATEQLNKILSDLHAHGKSKSNTSLREIIKNAVRSIVFDYYTNLNTNVRRDVKQKIEHFWKRYIPNADTSDNIINEAKKTKPVSRKHTADIDVKQSDYKKVGIKLDKKRYKNNRKDTVNGPVKSQEKVKKILSPQYTGSTVQQKTKIKHQEESSNGESLEFYQEPKDSTKHNKSIQTKKTSQRTLMKSKKKSEKFEAVNVTTKIPVDKTISNIWIEESTGRLPKAVLDKLANKSRRQEVTTRRTKKHGPKHNNKNGKSQKSWHGKIYEPKHVQTSGKEFNKKYQNIRKHRTKYDSQSKHSSRQTSSVDTKRKPDKNSNIFNIELHKRTKGPFRVELNHADRSSAAATKTQKFLDVLEEPIRAKPGKTIKPPRGARVAANKKLAAPSRTQRVKYNESRRMKTLQMTHSKKKNLLSRKFQSLSSNEGTIVEKPEIKFDERPEHQLQQSGNSLEKDLYVIKKIRNLERELEEVKSRLNDKTKIKHSAPKENQNIRYISDTKTRSGVNRPINDFKLRQKNVETSETIDNKTVVNIIETKNIQQITSKYNDTETDKSRIHVSATGTKVTDSPQSSEPSKLKRVITEMMPPRTNRFAVVSKPKPGQTDIIGPAENKITSPNEKKYIQGLLSKYQKLLSDLENGKINIITDGNLNDLQKTQDGLLQMIENINKDKKFLLELEKNKGKKSKNDFKSDVNMNSNILRDRKENTNLMIRTDNKTDIKTKVKNDRINVLDINIEDIKNTLKGVPLTKAVKDQILYYEKMQNESLQMSKTTNVTDNVLKKPIKENDFKFMNKGIISKTTNVTNNILNKPIKENDFKNIDKNVNFQTANVTYNILNKPIKENDFKNIDKGINSQTANVTNNILNIPIKEKDFKTINKDINTQTTNVTNNILNKLIKETDLRSIDKYINSKANFRSHSDISNDFKSETENPNIIRLANNREDKNSKKNKVKDIVKEVKSKINVNADVINGQTTKLPHHKDPNDGKSNLAKTKPRRPNINKFITDPISVPNLLGPTNTVDNNIIASLQKAFLDKTASKYHKLMAEFDNNMKTIKLKDVSQNQFKNYKHVPEDLGTKKLYDEFEALKKKLFSKSTNKLSKAKKSNTNEKHIVEPETSFRSRVHKNPNKLQDTKEKTKVTEAIGDRYPFSEKNKKNELKVGNEHQTSAVNKLQEIIIEDTKSEGNSKVSDGTPLNRDGLEAVEGTEPKNRHIESTSILAQATEATSVAIVTAVASTPITLILPTIEDFVPQDTSLQPL